MATDRLAKLNDLQHRILGAARSTLAWKELTIEIGPSPLLGECRQLIGVMTDACRIAMAQMPAGPREVWLAEQRLERDAVEHRAGQLADLIRREHVPAPRRGTPRRPAAPAGEVDWLMEAHRILDAAGSGLTMGQTVQQLQISREQMLRVLRMAGVPTPWTKGRIPSGGVRATRQYRLAVETLAAKMAADGR